MVKYIFIKSPDEWATTKQACRDKRVVRLNLFHYLHYASLTARSLSTLVTPQCNPTMCNRTSCAQVHELP